MKKIGLLFAASVASLAFSAPASAVVLTFATFSAPTTAKNFSFVNSGNSTAVSRVNDAVLYTISSPTSNQPGSVIVQFSFLQSALAAYFTNVDAKFTYNAAIAKGTPAVSAFGGLAQQGMSGTFSFLTTSAITVGGPNFAPHTFAAGSNLLSGTFSSSTLFGSGSSAATSSSTQGGSTVTFSSDFLDFTQTLDRDRSVTLTAISPSLSKHAGANQALNSFRATAGGQFSSDPAPLINGLVPEPATWAMMLAGFGMVGFGLRTSRKSAVRVTYA